MKLYGTEVSYCKVELNGMTAHLWRLSAQSVVQKNASVQAESAEENQSNLDTTHPWSPINSQ